MQDLQNIVKQIEEKTEGRCNDPRLLQYIKQIEEDIKKELT